MPDSLIDLAGLKVGAEEFLAAVLATAAQPIWVVDPDGVIRFANPAALAALGYDSADELFGCNSHETIHYRHPDGRPYPAATCPMLLPRATGETVARDLDWFFRRDGSMFPVSYASAPIAMPEGRGAVVAFTDIEARLRAEEVLRAHDAVLATQQASLRRVATLVAAGATSAAVFAAIAREVAGVLRLPLVVMWRCEPDGMATVIGEWSARSQPFHAGSRWPVDGLMAVGHVQRARRAVRVDDFAEAGGALAGVVHDAGIRSGAGAPILVDGALWGVMAVGRTDREPLPNHIEDRLAELTDLVATAISRTASREQHSRLATEQAALRRVATLVAQRVPPPDAFAAVARELGLLLGVDLTHMGRYERDGTATAVAGWSRDSDHIPAGSRLPVDGKNVSALVQRTGRPARMDSYVNAAGSLAELMRGLGVRSSVGAPIVVDQHLWGVMIASSKDDEPLPADTESRIAAFTELVATAISNTEAQAEVSRLADDQAALRRVATLVAQGVPPSRLFAAVAEEVGRLLAAHLTGMMRFEPGHMVSSVANWAADGDHVAVAGQWPTEGESLAPTILRTGAPARIDDWTDVPGPIADFIRDKLGIGSSVGSPIVVEGRVWGAIVAHSRPGESLPADVEGRLTNFTELVATAISNAHARAEVRRLADEQAALRRVATLVARASSPGEVFAAVAEEASLLLDVENTTLARYEADGTCTLMAVRDVRESPIAVGSRVVVDGENVTAIVQRTGRPARLDDYPTRGSGTLGAAVRGWGIRSAVGTPIVVDGRLWGVMIVAWRRSASLPVGTEARVAEFTELVATAISKIQAQSDLAASRARIIAATDQERRRVVRDLHDGAQQRLVHTVVTLKMALPALSRGDAAAADLVSEALDHAEQATAELRELSSGILPSVLTLGGLRAGLTALASRTPVPVDVEVSAGRLAPAVEATAYFLVAEALTNVAKHARATHAAVTAEVEQGTLLVEVRDDGAGGARPDGSGLLGLRDRLAALDGEFRVESPVDGGTLVAAAIPLPG